jgi:hypothetical protein
MVSIQTFGPSMYFIMTKIFSGGRFTDIIPYLPKLRKMGFNSLLISPPNTQTVDHHDGQGENNHGYWISSHSEIDPARGGIEGFEKLIQASKANGIQLIIDAPLNQFGYIDDPNGMVRIGNKLVSINDPNYFYPQPANGPIRQSEIYKSMDEERDHSKLLALNKELHRLSIAGMIKPRTENPEVYDDFLTSYKIDIDLEAKHDSDASIRYDAAKHLDNDFLISLTDDLNSYAKTLHRKVTFTWEFYTYSQYTLDFFAKRALDTIKDSKRTFFFDFPLSIELRKIHDPSPEKKYDMRWLQWFVEYRNSHSPIDQYIPIIEDHDFGTPIKNPYNSQLIYALSEFFSQNPTVLFQGTEEANSKYDGRAYVAEVNPKGNIAQLRLNMGRALKDYRLDHSAQKVLFSDTDFIAAERALPQKSIFILANKSDSQRSYDLPLAFQNFKLDTVSKEGPVAHSSTPGHIHFELGPKSFIVIEVTR